jgi:hypothetical protein
LPITRRNEIQEANQIVELPYEVEDLYEDDHQENEIFAYSFID